MIALSLAVYMAICLALGFLAWRRTQTLGDFILGGRRLGSFVTALSAQASDMSGWLLMGLPGLAYLAGFDAVWLVLGLIAGTWLNWRFVAARLRTRTEELGDALTLPDYFERRFDDRTRLLRTIAALFILVFFAFYTSSGFVAAGKLFQSLFDLPYVAAMFCGSIVLLAYTFFGGFLAVSWSDVLQGSLMFFALVLVAALGLHLAGGSDAFAALAARDPALLDPLAGDGGAPLGWIGITSLLGWGLGYAGQPHILARFMAIRHAGEMATARRVAMVWVVTVLVAAVLVGFTGVLVLDAPLAGADSERVFIRMATQLFHPIVAGICLAAILAAVMSTAAAQLLVSSAAFAQDLYRGLLRPAAGRAELLWVGRAAVLGIAVIAFLLGLDPDSRVLALVSWAWAGFGAAFGPAIILSLYWPAMTRGGAIAGIVTGGLTVIVWPRLDGAIFELYELVPGFALSWLAIWAVSRWSRR
ncbi:MAG: sodium/proline symporter PutP [Gammaproteobacteria bacterium]|nr:sodium/proline symporter PutP [Gammaproteobacteria bacterium]